MRGERQNTNKGSSLLAPRKKQTQKSETKVRADRFLFVQFSNIENAPICNILHTIMGEKTIFI